MWDRAEKLRHFDGIDPNLKGHILASLFRPAFVRLVVAGRFAGIIREMGLTTLAQTGASLVDLFDWAYGQLQRKYRCEYLYKNEIIRELFVARHDPAVAIVTSEFPIDNNRLDLLLVNGTTVAYEIKTEYDRLERIPAQMLAYLSVFDHVNVVCDPSFVDRIRSLIDERVGVWSLTAEGTFHIERESASNLERIDPSAVFNLLHTSEYVTAVRRILGVAPDVPNTQRRKTYLNLFRTLPAEVAHNILVESLHARFAENAPDAVDSVPQSMFQMYYEANARTRSRVFDSMLLTCPLIDAMGE
jgi:hypothetical protein